MILEVLEDVGYEGVRALAKIGPPAVPALIKALKNGKKKIRAHAAEALGKIGPKARAAVPALVQELRNQGDGKDTIAINIGENAFFRYPGPRSRAATALGQIGPEAKAAVPALAQVLKDDDSSIRTAAARALGNIGTAAVPALLKALQNDDARVRAASVTGLGQISPNAVSALGEIGADAKAAVPALVAAFKDASNELRTTIVAVLKAIGPVAVPILTRSLGDQENASGVRQGVAMALGTFGRQAKTAVPALEKALKDRGPYVRGAAADALGKIGPAAMHAVPALRALLDDPFVLVRQAARKAIVRIDPRAKLEPPPSVQPPVEQEDVF